MGGGSVGWAYVPFAACALLGIAWWTAGRRLPRRLSTDGGRLAQVWTFGLLIALSAFGDKKSWYLMPVYPGLAWIGALWFNRAMPRGLVRALWRIGPAAAAAVLIVVLTLRPSFERPGGNEPAMPTIEAFLRESPTADCWNGSVHHYDGARLYLKTGAWPKFGRDDNTGERWAVPVGAYLLFDTRRGAPDPTDRAITSDGPFVLVQRTSATAAPPIADTAPGR